MRSRPLILTILIAGMLLVGCREYDVRVAVDADGGGSRTTSVVSRSPLRPEFRHLLGLAGDDWRVILFNGPDGMETYRYQRRLEVADRDRWPATGGTLLLGTADGEIRLESEIQVEKARGAGGERHVYRETLYWVGLQERATAVVAGDYAAMLRREFPSLPADLVDEAQAAVAAAIDSNWADLADAEYVRIKEAEFAKQVNAINGGLFQQAGVAPELVEKIAKRTTKWRYYKSLKTALPGLRQSVNARLKLRVTMPAPVSGGNADVIKGNTASFLLDLGRTAADSVTLEVVCEP